MSPDDLVDILRIERRSFSHPWTREQILDEVGRADIARCLVAGQGDPPMLCGYIMAWLVTDELHITNMAVDPDFRGQGIAGTMLLDLLRDAAGEGARWCVLEVRRSNSGARSLYEKHGFRTIGRRRRYYPDGEDALVMGVELVIGDQ
jgi:ribosomal-protein-alanine N-acetyltransferase